MQWPLLQKIHLLQAISLMFGVINCIHSRGKKHKHYGNGVTLRVQNLCLECCQSLGQSICQQSRFRSFQRGSVSLCWSKGCKLMVHQNLKIIQSSGTWTRAEGEWFDSGRQAELVLVPAKFLLSLQMESFLFFSILSKKREEFQN